MITFSDWRPRPEARESYTDQVVNAAVAEANTAAPNTQLATVEACARLWEAGFASGTTEALSPALMALCGRSLILRGEFVAWRSRNSGMFPASDHDVQGASPSPDRWLYRLSLPTPGDTITRNAEADRVLHVRIGATVRQPWRGCSPLLNAVATRDVLTQIERSLTDEHSGPAKNLLPAPDPDAQSEVATLIGTRDGKPVLVEATELDLPGEGQGGRTTWKPQRIGPAPSEATITAREATERSILAAAGIPIELVQPSSGSDAREGWRRFLFGTIAPAAAILSSELRRLGQPDRIDFSELRASDLAGRARAYKQLTEAGVARADVARLTGLD